MRRVRGIVIGLAMCSVVIAGCGGSSSGSYSSSSQSRPTSKPATTTQTKTPPGSVRVVKGDTVYGIARRYGASPKEIIAVNRLQPPYHLEIGQNLRLPAPRVHVVVKGDTVYGISRRYGVDM